MPQSRHAPAFLVRQWGHAVIAGSSVNGWPQRAQVVSTPSRSVRSGGGLARRAAPSGWSPGAAQARGRRPPTPWGMSAAPPRRCTLVLVAALAAAALGGCGAGADGGQSPSAPAGAVDPSADGAVIGPVNGARDVAGDQERRDAQVEQQP